MSLRPAALLASLALALGGCPAPQVGVVTGPGVLDEPATSTAPAPGATSPTSTPTTAPHLPRATSAARATPTAPDADGDGVADDADRCPDEPEDVDGRDDADGCPDPDLVVVEARDPVITERVRFAAGKAALDGAGRTLLDMVATVLAEHPEIQLVALEGHTDGREPASLGMARAEAARRYLLGKGVAADRLTVVGRGATALLDSATTDAARANNRRVELVVAVRVDAP